ncbi:zinc transporter ZupT [Candidatus Woesearchaeota archaeon]|nr:zinc transporter ZupT [Candidatus Woesearchaeota archaeon]
MDASSIWIAFGLTLFAGLSTGIGSTLAFFAKRTNTKFLSLALGFSAGVMIYVSFVEIFPDANECLNSVYGARLGTWITVIAFFSGMAVIALIDKLVPSYENPHEIKRIEEMRDVKSMKADKAIKKEPEAHTLASKYRNLLRCGTCAAVAIAVHNFPEGIATFTSAVKDPSLGIAIAIAVAIHNIPEGISISIPIFYATGNRKKAFIWSFLSGLSEPLGAVLGYFILVSFFNDLMFGVVFAAVAGIMVFISLDQLMPTAREYGEHHLSIYGLVCGMMVMALSLLLLI